MEPANTPQKRGKYFFPNHHFQVLCAGISHVIGTFLRSVSSCYILYIYDICFPIRYRSEASSWSLRAWCVWSIPYSCSEILFCFGFHCIRVCTSNSPRGKTPPKLRRRRSWKRRSKQLPTWSICRTSLFEVDDQIEKKDSSKVGFWRFVQVLWFSVFFWPQVMFFLPFGSLKKAQEDCEKNPRVFAPEKWHLDQVHNPPLGTWKVEVWERPQKRWHPNGSCDTVDGRNPVNQLIW